MKRKMLSLGVMILFYIFSGINHFFHPHSYFVMIPPYIPHHEFINYVAGTVEIFFALLLMFPKTRKFAATGIIAMLIIYIPTHIYIIEMNGDMGSAFHIAPWLAWTRLFIGQPFLILWAWWHREDRENTRGILV